MSEETQKLELPFKEITKEEIANRAELRSESFDHVLQGNDTYKIRTLDIGVRDGFNARIVYDGIEELADSIDANGLLTPLTVDVLKNGEVWLERGHRRLRALLLLHDRYTDQLREEEFTKRFGYVICFINSKNVTELDRIKALYVSNSVKPLNPVENAEVVNRLKVYYGYTHEKIAAELGISRQSVDNYAKIADLPDDVKQAIMNENISLNAALAVIRKIKDADEQADRFQELMTAKTTRADNSRSSGNGERSESSINREMGGPLGGEDDTDSSEKDELQGLNTTSEEVKELNESIGMLDKVVISVDGLKDQHAQFVNDIQILLGAIRVRVEKTKDYLIKTQK